MNIKSAFLQGSSFKVSKTLSPPNGLSTKEQHEVYFSTQNMSPSQIFNLRDSNYWYHCHIIKG